MNKEVIRFLRYLVNDRRVQDESDWESVLPISQRIINSDSEKSGSITLPGNPAIREMWTGRGSPRVTRVLLLWPTVGRAPKFDSIRHLSLAYCSSPVWVRMYIRRGTLTQGGPAARGGGGGGRGL